MSSEGHASYRRRTSFSVRATHAPGPDGQLGPGRVYILRSEATPTLFKVGFTTVRAHYRAQEISRGTGVPEPFGVYYESVPVPDAYQIEQAILKDFDAARPNKRKEFLELRVLGEVLERLPPREVPSH